MKDLGILILRIGLGSSMLRHGVSKVAKIIEGDLSFADPIWLGEVPSLFLATFAEFACSVLIIIGYKTKLASIPLSVTMAVAAFITHHNDPWESKEMAFIYLTGFVAIGLLGAGKYSLDKK